MSDCHAGVVVVAVMVITTVLVSIVMLIVWQWHCLAVSALLCLLIAMEGVLLSAVLYKVRHSPPLLVAFATGAQAACALCRAVTLTMLEENCQSSPLFFNTESVSVRSVRLAACTASGRQRRRLGSAGPGGRLVPAGNCRGGAVPDRHLALGRPAAAAPQPGLLGAPRGGPAARLPPARQRQVAPPLAALELLSPAAARPLRHTAGVLPYLLYLGASAMRSGFRGQAE